MNNASDQFSSLATLAEWKMREDFRLSVQSADWRWVREWTTKFAKFVQVQGRHPEEASIKQSAVSNLSPEDKWPKNMAAEYAKCGALFEATKKKRLRVCCEGTQLAAFSVLRHLQAEHRLNMEIISDYPTGKTLTRTLESDVHGHFDFAVITFAPTVLEASSKFSMNYRALRVLHREGQRILRKKSRKSRWKTNDAKASSQLHPTLYLVRHTSAHASVIGQVHRLRYLESAAHLINSTMLPPSDETWFVIWQPVAEWLLSKPYFRLEPVNEDGLAEEHPIVLFCNRHLDDDSPNTRTIRDQFNELFWLQWSKFKAKKEDAWHCIKDQIPIGFCDQFGDHFNPNEFSDYYWYRTEQHPRLEKESLAILRVLSGKKMPHTYEKLTIDKSDPAVSGREDLPGSTQTVKVHVDRLIQLGFVWRVHPKGGVSITAKGERFVISHVS